MRKMINMLGLMAALVVGTATVSHAAEGNCCKPDAACCKPDAPCCPK
jgi:hypothetical protein